MGELRDPEEKRRRVSRLQATIEEALDGFPVPDWAPRVLTYPLDDAITRFEASVFDETWNMLPEERGTFLFVQHVLERLLGTSEPDDADAFFLPLYFPVHEVHGTALARSLPDLEFLGTGKRHLLCSPWDTYPRPWLRRANRYCVVQSGLIGHEAWIAEQASWFDDRFTLLTMESSIDLHPNDIGVLPVVLPGPAGPPPAERPLLYSFCGVTTYDTLAPNHVRGALRESTWDALQASPRDDVFVGTLEDAQERFGSATTYRDIPAMSRFTLCPAGWARWSFRLVEAVEARSVPVILSDYYVRPHAPRVPWDRFSLHLPERAIERIDEILRALPPRRVAGLSAACSSERALFDLRSRARLLIEALAARVGRRSGAGGAVLVS